MNDQITTLNSSPVFPKGQQRNLDFYSALKEVVMGKKATREAWYDMDVYMFIRAETLHIKRSVPDSNINEHTFILSLGDMVATDWVVFE